MTGSPAQTPSMITVDVVDADSGHVLTRWESPHAWYAPGDVVVLEDAGELTVIERQWYEPDTLGLRVRKDPKRGA